MAKAIMIQGTMSNAGKSMLAAGLCRIFRQDGYRVAPFKSQNMALNSFITREGLEMGRAQVMQAEAAGIEPSVLMNPILLKPTNDVGSQVIVNGEVLGNMSAREYFAYKSKLVPAVMKAYEALDRAYDIIVIEGAGSPAEINLKADDIVNMGMAKRAKAPVLLVGDIDRGGVFAQLVGTVMLLEEDERALVKGLIINKFRGDKTILDPGIAMLEERAHKPVVGVAPYLPVELEDEDSLTERFEGSREAGLIDLAVIRVPRISNFTDFNPFERMPGVSLRYVSQVGELKNPDMILLPGTKNTMEDLLWMRQNGLEAAVKKAAAAGTPIFGICGGYQMLGETLCDPLGVEAGGTLRGMGLLPMRTVFSAEKTRTRAAGRFEGIGGLLSELEGAALEGYEIHMGVSEPCGGAEEEKGAGRSKPCAGTGEESGIEAAKPYEGTEEKGSTGAAKPYEGTEEKGSTGAAKPGAGTGEESGAGRSKPRAGALTRITDTSASGEGERADGMWKDNVYGTYVHGIFDREEVADGVIRALGRRKGIDTADMTGVDYQAFKETQYDLLAAELRKHLDLEAIYRILEEGV